MGIISEEINALKGLVESLKKPGVSSNRPSTASTNATEKPKPAPLTARAPPSRPVPTLKKETSKSGEETKSNKGSSRASSPAAKTTGQAKI